MPGGASVKQIAHYGQEVASGRFRRFDHGLLGNMREYGSLSPPPYVLQRVSAPVALFYGRNDWLVARRDVERLAEELPNVVAKRAVPHPRFSHVDFLWAKDARVLVYKEMMELMRKYS